MVHYVHVLTGSGNFQNMMGGKGVNLAYVLMWRCAYVVKIQVSQSAIHGHLGMVCEPMGSMPGARPVKMVSNKSR